MYEWTYHTHSSRVKILYREVHISWYCCRDLTTPPETRKKSRRTTGGGWPPHEVHCYNYHHLLAVRSVIVKPKTHTRAGLAYRAEQQQQQHPLREKKWPHHYYSTYIHSPTYPRVLRPRCHGKTRNSMHDTQKLRVNKPYRVKVFGYLFSQKMISKWNAESRIFFPPRRDFFLCTESSTPATRITRQEISHSQIRQVSI